MWLDEFCLAGLRLVFSVLGWLVVWLGWLVEVVFVVDVFALVCCALWVGVLV